MSAEASGQGLRVLMISSEWPSAEHPGSGVFIEQQARFLRSAGVDVDVVAFRGAKDPRRYVSAWIEVQRRVRAAEYHLVHAQFGQSGLLALPKRLPLVVTFRGDDLFGIRDSKGRTTPVGRLLQRLSRLVARNADATIVVSEHLTHYLDHAGPVHVVPSGID